MSSGLTWVNIESPYSGKVHQVNLTTKEIERCNTDAAFFSSLCIKYDQLQKNNNVGLKVNEIENSPRLTFDVSNQENIDQVYSTLPEELEEIFISLVQERPALWNFKLPLRERSKEILERNWREIVEELGVNISIDALKSKWKNLRDSFLRARNNINRKIPSGASSIERLEAEKLKARHKHYEILEFLTTNLDLKRSITNITEDEETMDSSRPSSRSFETPSTGRTKKSRSMADSMSSVDTAFISAVQNLGGNQQETLTASQHFCMRLADSLQRLPRVIKNNVEVKILQLVVEAENEYLNSQN